MFPTWETFLGCSMPGENVSMLYNISSVSALQAPSSFIFLEWYILFPKYWRAASMQNNAHFLIHEPREVALFQFTQLFKWEINQSKETSELRSICISSLCTWNIHKELQRTILSDWVRSIGSDAFSNTRFALSIFTCCRSWCPGFGSPGSSAS